MYFGVLQSFFSSPQSDPTVQYY